MFIVKLLKWSGFAHLTSLTFIVSHFWYPFQVPRFVLGMVVAEGVLHVKLSEADSRWLGRATDAVVVVALLLSFGVNDESMVYIM